LIRTLPAGTSFLKKLITSAESAFIVVPPIPLNIVARTSSVNTQCFKKQILFAGLLVNHYRLKLEGLTEEKYHAKTPRRKDRRKSKRVLECRSLEADSES
jgi:hypothetical protein